MKKLLTALLVCIMLSSFVFARVPTFESTIGADIEEPTSPIVKPSNPSDPIENYESNSGNDGGCGITCNRERNIRKYRQDYRICLNESWKELEPKYAELNIWGALNVWNQSKYLICADHNANVWIKFLPLI